LGSALPVFTMSLVRIEGTSDPHSTSGQDYSLVVLAKTVGVLIGLPIMTLVWSAGISIGGFGLGLPYYTSSVSGKPL
jgi:hypothetical protein